MSCLSVESRMHINKFVGKVEKMHLKQKKRISLACYFITLNRNNYGDKKNHVGTVVLLIIDINDKYPCRCCSVRLFSTFSYVPIQLPNGLINIYPEGDDFSQCLYFTVSNDICTLKQLVSVPRSIKWFVWPHCDLVWD